MKNSYKIYNSQEAFDYVLYMIIGSYFKNAFCASDWYEKRLYISYNQTREALQLKMEKKVIRFMDEKVIPQIGEVFNGSEAKVRFVKMDEGNHEVRFCLENCDIRFFGVYKGKKTKISCYVWKNTVDSENKGCERPKLCETRVGCAA